MLQYISKFKQMLLRYIFTIYACIIFSKNTFSVNIYLLTTNLHGPKMDIPFNLADLIPGGAQPPIARLENKKLLHHWSRKLRRQPRSILFEKAIDLLGQLSAEVNYNHFIMVKCVHFMLLAELKKKIKKH